MEQFAVGRGEPLTAAQAFTKLALAAWAAALRSDGGRIHFDCLGKERFYVGRAVNCVLIPSSFSC